MAFYNPHTAAPLSPSLPESQTASYITYNERHIRPHAYRPFRIPSVKKATTAHDMITRLLSLGDHIPHGAFLPSSKPRRPLVLKPTAAVSRVDRPSKEVSIETSTLPKLSLRRHRTIHPMSPAAATSLGRGSSCSSTASTIRPPPPELKKAARASMPPPRLPSFNVPPLPSFEITTTSSIKVAPSPPSSEDEEVSTPQQGRDIQLPSVNPKEQELETEPRGVITMPGTPLNIPPTPLDIPVDWDDLRQRWSPQHSTYQPAQEEGWYEDDNADDDIISDGALIEEEEPPVPTHAYAVGGTAPSTGISEVKLSSITSKDLGEYFLLEPMQLRLHSQHSSALFTEEEWSPPLPTPSQPQAKTVQNPVISPAPGPRHRRRGSGLLILLPDPDLFGSSSILSPTATDFPPPPPTVPPSPLYLNTRASTEPLPKLALGSTTTTTKAPAPSKSILKPQGQTRMKRHGRLLSFDEAELVRRTVRFSGTLDLQFDYAKFEQRKDGTASIDTASIENCVSEKAVSTGSKPHKEPLPPIIAPGESFLSVLSPLTPTAPQRRT